MRIERWLRQGGQGSISNFSPFADHRWEGELKISSMKRQRDRLGRFPVCKGRKLIAKFRPRAFLECIISIGYRSLWDARLRSAQIMERYSHHDCLVHLTYRGSLPCWESRVIDVIQHVQCYGPDMEEQETANQDTRCIDLIFKSIEESKSSLRGQQSGSRRSIVNLIAYRIEWDEKDQGSYITSIEDVEGVDSLPSYLWHQLSKDIPRQGLDLGNCMTRNGLPPYIIDVDHCIEIVDTNFSHQSRTTSFRHITRHSGEYRIAIDRLVMYSDGGYPLFHCVFYYLAAYEHT